MNGSPQRPGLKVEIGFDTVTEPNNATNDALGGAAAAPNDGICSLRRPAPSEWRTD
jgi:hypothetical protein